MTQLRTVPCCVPGAVDSATNPKVAYLTLGSGSPIFTCPGVTVTSFDAYELDTMTAQVLGEYAGLVISMACDQEFLATQADKLEEYVNAGGRIALTGHPVVKFLPGQGDYRDLHYVANEELSLVPGDPHPVWNGVDLLDVSARRAVSGFYARGYTINHPRGAIITTRIGSEKLPCDYVYAHGQGRILIHPGIEFFVFTQDHNSAARLLPQLLKWLAHDDSI